MIFTSNINYRKEKMKRTLTTIYLVFLCTAFSFAQEKTSKNLFYGDLTYGYETDWGNTGFLIGLGYQRNLSRKFIFQADLQNFRTDVIKVNLQYLIEFPNEERYDHSAFLSTSLGYTVIGKTDKFNITLKGGPTLFHIKYKIRTFYQSIFYAKGSTIPITDQGYILSFQLNPSNGTEVAIPSSVKYCEKNMYSLGYNFGLDINIPIKKKNFLGLSFVSYAQDSPFQYAFIFIPVISYKVRF